MDWPWTIGLVALAVTLAVAAFKVTKLWLGLLGVGLAATLIAILFSFQSLTGLDLTDNVIISLCVTILAGILSFPRLRRWWLLDSKPAPDAEPVNPNALNPMESYFSKRIVQIADLIYYGPRIEGKTFEDCHIKGPAIVIFRGGSLDSTIFIGDRDLSFVELPVNGIIGVVEFVRCTFRRCRFEAVGVMASAEEIALFKKTWTS